MIFQWKSNNVITSEGFFFTACVISHANYFTVLLRDCFFLNETSWSLFLSLVYLTNHHFLINVQLHPLGGCSSPCCGCDFCGSINTLIYLFIQTLWLICGFLSSFLEEYEYKIWKEVHAHFFLSSDQYLSLVDD